MSPEPATAEDRRHGPAFALLDREGAIVASTEVFDQCVGAGPLDAPAARDAVGAVIDSITDRTSAELTVDGVPGTMHVEAVLTVQGWRLAVVEVDIERPEPEPRAVADWLSAFCATATAMVLVKDLFGTHLAVNPAYVALLEVDPVTILGLRDRDLAPLQTLDGPRAGPAHETSATALEYAVPAFDRRPAIAVFRFPILDPEGAPVVVVSVASRADDAAVARRECERVLRLGAWLATDRETLRHDALADWRVSPVRPGHRRDGLHEAGLVSGAAPNPGSAHSPAVNPSAPAIASTGIGLSGPDLEKLVDAVSAAGQAAATATARVIELEQELRDTHAELLRERAERTAAQEQLQTQLNLVNQRSQVELGQLRTRALEAESTRSGLEGRLAQLSDQLATSQREVLELHAALRAARAAQAEAPTAHTPAEPQPEPGTGPEPEPAQLGWTTAAQAALADGLRGCLNLRSVLSEAVRLTGGGGGWDLAAAWTASPDGVSWSVSATWLRSPVEMAALETALWQEPQRAPATVAQAATADGPAWQDLANAPTDAHLRRLAGAGLATVTLVPVNTAGRTVALLELATTRRVAPVPAADAALASIAEQVAHAAERVSAGAGQSQWGRRR